MHLGKNAVRAGLSLSVGGVQLTLIVVRSIAVFRVWIVTSCGQVASCPSGLRPGLWCSCIARMTCCIQTMTGEPCMSRLHGGAGSGCGLASPCEPFSQ